MRYARSHQYVQAGSGPEDNRQLFFACAPSSTTEEQITQLFAQFGEVSHAVAGLGGRTAILAATATDGATG